MKAVILYQGERKAHDQLETTNAFWPSASAIARPMSVCGQAAQALRAFGFRWSS